LHPSYTSILSHTSFNSSYHNPASHSFPTRRSSDLVFLKFPDNLPIQGGVPIMYQGECVGAIGVSGVQSHEDEQIANAFALVHDRDRKSTRLNSSHGSISYAVFCLKKKKKR